MFLDPKPEPAPSFAERRRLFDIPRSSWDDYNRALISTGGGVAAPRSRSALPEARELLCTDAEALTPAEVITALLKRRSIFSSTVASARTSSHRPSRTERSEIARTTRCESTAWTCKAVVEEGNLGSRSGRIEDALAGGLVNTDAMNSAGVDTSAG